MARARRIVTAPTSVDGFLDALRSKKGLNSNYELAKYLGVRLQVISNYRHKRSLPDEVMAIRLADELGLDRGYVIACVAAERASRSKNPELADTWREMADKLGVLAVATVAVALGLALAPDLSTTDAASAILTAFNGTGLYIM